MNAYVHITPVPAPLEEGRVRAYKALLDEQERRTLELVEQLTRMRFERDALQAKLDILKDAQTR